jgi:CHAT domain-containing protein
MPGPERTMAAGGTDVLTSRDGMFRAIPRMLSGLFADQVRLLDERRPGLTRSAVKDAVHAEPDVLVLVAHGHLDPTTHQMSGLLVNPQGEVGWQSIALRAGQLFEFRDLPLSPAPPLHSSARAEVLTTAELEIFTQLRSELVVLLACSSGAGHLMAGDEPASIAETFLRLGAASVIAPMWDAGYEASLEWVAAFFDEWLRQGRVKAVAARNATSRLRAELGDDHLERFGAFSIRGDFV